MTKKHDREKRLIAQVVDNVLELAKGSPWAVANILLPESKFREEFPMADNAINHFTVNLSTGIAAGERPGHSGAAAMIACAAALQDTLQWMEQNPAKARAAEDKVREHLERQGLTEEDFNNRDGAGNFRATDQAGYDCARLYENLEGPPPATIDGLRTLVRYASKEEQYIRKELERREYEYEAHYEQHQTFTWAWTMAMAAENSAKNPGANSGAGETQE